MRRMVNRAISCLVIAVTSVACATHDCTEIGCFDGVRFEMTPAVVADGAVTVELTGDGVALTCSQPIGIPGPCFDAGLTFWEENGTLVAIELGQRHPNTVTLRVLVAGSVAREVTTSVKYVDDQPNGEDCGGCRNASVDVPAP
ncbi:MAG TPA: hypothetical protein VMS65_16450 [Polyangiaceae bacterium]|nr:hypothetical protein [Polyangiaceae bacterium]